MSVKGYICQDCGSQEPEHTCSELAKAELRDAANFEKVKSLLAEVVEWKLTAMKLSLSIAGTDVSTPAKWATAQIEACTKLQSEVEVRREKMADIVRALGRGCGGMGHDEIAPIIFQLRTDKAKLRVALVGLVGADTAKELYGMEAILRISPISDDEKQNTITAIQALRETLPQ